MLTPRLMALRSRGQVDWQLVAAQKLRQRQRHMPHHRLCLINALTVQWGAVRHPQALLCFISDGLLGRMIWPSEPDALYMDCPEHDANPEPRSHTCDMHQAI